MVSTRAIVFCALQTMQQLAHHFLVTLFHVENVANSCAELSTFNPFVVGSTPAGPTNKTRVHTEDTIYSLYRSHR
jgi:hypothetical protein